MWGPVSSFIMVACLAAIGAPMAAEAAPIGPSLDAILVAFARGGDQTHTSTVISAIKTSPQLADQLNGLAASGALKGLTLVPAGVQRFSASHNNGIITLTPQFVDDQTPAGGGEALRSEFAARNLVFILGYMASKLETSEAVAAADAKGLADFRAQIARTPKGQGVDADSVLQMTLQIRLKDEARAYLQGWNDEVDAAMAAKGGLLTPPEAFRLLQQSRNTRVLLEAAMLPKADRLAPIGTLQFPPDEHNLQAIVSVLKHANVPDFQ